MIRHWKARLILRIAEVVGPSDSETDWRKYAARMRWLRRAGVKVGDRVIIRSGFRVLLSQCHQIAIGDDVLIGPRVHLWSFDSLVIERGSCLDGMNVLVNGGHDPDSLRPSSGPIKIGEGTHLGFSAKIVRPATLGARVKVLPGSIVVGDLPSEARCAGVPAKPMVVFDSPKSEWRWCPNGWPEGGDSKGKWDSAASVQPYIDGWKNYLQLLDQKRPFGYFSPVAVQHEVPHVPTLPAQNAVLIFAYALCRAARMKASLRVLDVGGALGYYKRLAESILPDVSFDYTCLDLPAFCSVGRKLASDVAFISFDEFTSPNKGYDFVLCYGALQYSRDWKGRIELISRSLRGSFLLGRLPVTEGNSFIMEQTPSSHGFTHTYPQWVFSRSEILDVCERNGLRLVREFLGGEKYDLPGAPETPECMAFLFAKD